MPLFSHPDPNPDHEHRQSAAPIMAALVVVVVVVGGVLLWSFLRPPDRNITESNRVGSAVAAYFTARGSGDAGKIAAMLCESNTRQPFAGETGTFTLTTIDRIDVDGDTATSDVTVSVNDSDTKATVDLRKVGQDWKVCAP